jgi:hypothetical protein
VAICHEIAARDKLERATRVGSRHNAAVDVVPVGQRSAPSDRTGRPRTRPAASISHVEVGFCDYWTLQSFPQPITSKAPSV